MQASVVAVMVAPLAALLLFAADSFPWIKVETYEATSTSLRAHFTLAEGCMRVRFLSDGRRRQVPEPLRVPWVPLENLVEGPPALAQFRRQLLRPNQRVDALGARPGERDMEFVVNNLDRTRKCSEWDPTFFRPLDTASVFTELAKNGALGLLLGAWLSQLLGLALLRRSKPGSWKPVLVLRLSGCLYLLSCAVSVAGLTHYSAVCRHRLKVLCSEFVLGITGGDVVLWPQDLQLQMATGSYFMLTSGFVSFLLGIHQLTEEFSPAVPSAAAASRVQSEVRRLSSPQIVPLRQESEDAEVSEVEETVKEKEDREFLLKALEVTKAQIKAHNRRVAGTVIMAMLAFVILLCGVAFFFGRVAVAQGIQNALRGPQLTVKQTTLSFRKAKESARELVLGAGNATAVGLSAAGTQTWHATRTAQRGLRDYGAAVRRTAKDWAEALRDPDWRQVLWNILLLPGRLALQGVGAIYHQLRHSASSLHQACSAALQRMKRTSHRWWNMFRMRQLQNSDDKNDNDSAAEQRRQLRWPWQKEKVVTVQEVPWWKRLLPKKPQAA